MSPRRTCLSSHDFVKRRSPLGTLHDVLGKVCKVPSHPSGASAYEGFSHSWQGGRAQVSVRKLKSSMWTRCTTCSRCARFPLASGVRECAFRFPASTRSKVSVICLLDAWNRAWHGDHCGDAPSARRSNNMPRSGEVLVSKKDTPGSDQRGQRTHTGGHPRHGRASLCCVWSLVILATSATV